MISKTISTEHGDVSSQAEVHHDDNGQVRLHVISVLGDSKHEHIVTVGAEDGKDAISGMTEEELKNSLQKHLDKVRDDAAKVLSGRAKVQKIAGGLV
jgi:hypothetical protein